MGHGLLIREGEGIEIIPNKFTYKGSFKKNIRNGFGIVINRNGDRYKGYWKNNHYEGRGKLYSLTSIYDGDFLKGMKSG